MNRPTRRLLTALAASALTVALAPAPSASADTSLVGTFALQGGSCTGGTASGSYFRMILHSGGPNGPFLDNSSSSCSDQSYTLLAPGTDGGLVTGAYQPEPSPAFDSNGNGRAGRITKPARFYGVDFAASTNPVDPQTKREVTAPRVTVSGRSLTADLRSFSVSWNSQQFNQGSPKPDGSLPGNTRRASGTYDSATGAFTLQWTSQIQGGPFDGFTGLWHLTGRFSPSAHPGATGTPATKPSSVPSSPSAVTRTTGPRAVQSPSAGATATAGGSAAPTGAPDQGGATAVPSGQPSSPAPSEAPQDQATSSGGSGTTRWPWVLLAAVLAAGVGVAVVRLRARG